MKVSRGDLSPEELRGLAAVMRTYAGGYARIVRGDDLRHGARRVFHDGAFPARMRVRVAANLLQRDGVRADLLDAFLRRALRADEIHHDAVRGLVRDAQALVRP